MMRSLLPMLSCETPLWGVLPWPRFGVRCSERVRSRDRTLFKHTTVLQRASTSPPYRDFMAVAESMGRMCEGDEVDTYWLASKIFEKLCHQVSKDVIKEMSEMCHKHLAQDSGPLYR